MNKPCPDMRDQIADAVLGALDTQQAEALQEHLAGCDACRRYARSLKEHTQSLVALGQEIEAGMGARQDKVIEALQGVSPADAGATRVIPFVGGFLRTAVAAVLVLGTGVGIGRWTVPRSVDVEGLRAELEASIAASVAPAVQESILSQVDQRLLAALATNTANLRTDLGDQLRGDLQLFAAQFTSGSERMIEKRFTELVQLIEEARLKDRQRVAKALEQIEQNRLHDKTQIGMGLQSLAALTVKATPAIQH
jgi:anti-sigma factor RsiW